MMKKIVKKYLLPTLVQIKAEQLYHLVTNKKMLNIFYHGVVNTDSTKIFPRHIVKDQFDQHMKYLSKNFNIISLAEAFDIYKQGIKPDRKTLTVSFDDGYLNNLQNALPIIEKYKIKTTFFISGICSENEPYMMWSDTIAFARFFTNDDHMKIGGEEFFKCGRYDMVSPENNLSIFEFIKNLQYHERDSVLNDLVSKLDLGLKIKELPSEYWKLMNKEQIKQLSESELVTIGSHGQLHYNLVNISEDEAKNELVLSKNILSDIIQKDIDMISFPDGSYNERIKRIAYESGYKGLLAVDYRCASDKNDKNIMNRWGVSATTTFETIAFTLNKAFIYHGF